MLIFFEIMGWCPLAVPLRSNSRSLGTAYILPASSLHVWKSNVPFHTLLLNLSDVSNCFQMCSYTTLLQSGVTSQENIKVARWCGRAARSSLPERGIAAEFTLPSTDGDRGQISYSARGGNESRQVERKRLTSAMSYAGTEFKLYSVQCLSLA